MLRLTLILVIIIYAVMIIFSDAMPDGSSRLVDDATVAPGDPTVTEPDDSALRQTADGRLVLTTESGQDLLISAVITSREDPPEGPGTPTPSTPEANPAAEAEPTATGGADVDTPDAVPDEQPTPVAPEELGALRLAVTGDRVNFRAGPSTDDAILTALNRGDVVELIEAVGDGWAHLRVVETGQTGYMSIDFLEPTR